MGDLLERLADLHQVRPARGADPRADAPRAQAASRLVGDQERMIEDQKAALQAAGRTFLALSQRHSVEEGAWVATMHESIEVMTSVARSAKESDRLLRLAKDRAEKAEAQCCRLSRQLALLTVAKDPAELARHGLKKAAE
jgi:hypothetical protein